MQHAQRLFGRSKLSGGSATDATTTDVFNLIDLLNAGHHDRDGLSPQWLERKSEQRLGFARGKYQTSEGVELEQRGTDLRSVSGGRVNLYLREQRSATFEKAEPFIRSAHTSRSNRLER